MAQTQLPPIHRIDRIGRRIVELTSTRCPVCDRLMRTHPACASCGALLGPGHSEPVVSVDGRCGWCRRRTP